MINNMTKKEIEKLLENDVYTFEIYAYNYDNPNSKFLGCSGGKNLTTQNLISNSWDLYNLIKNVKDFIMIEYGSTHMFIPNKNFYMIERSKYLDIIPLEKDLIRAFTNSIIYLVNIDLHVKNINEIENLLKLDYIKTL